MNTEEIIKNKQATIVDVRTRAEFNGGSVAGAVNIPLNEIPLRMDELKELNTPLVFCCASGNRSGQAVAYLNRQGMENCYNGGSWLEVNYLSSQSA
ncbi:rhodanese-like domain-containing protein [Salegentibacter sp. HM20]